MIRNWYNQIPHPALKTKREITKYINWRQFTKGTRGKPNEIYFLNRLLYIGKFYHISCNTVLFRVFNSVNPLCLYVYIYTNKYYYYYTVEEF